MMTMREHKRFRRKRAPPGTPLWERLPDELVERIVGYVRQRIFATEPWSNARRLVRIQSVVAAAVHNVARFSPPRDAPGFPKTCAVALCRRLDHAAVKLDRRLQHRRMVHAVLPKRKARNAAA